MNRSVVHVQRKDGSKAKGAKVVLGFTMGMTKPAFTDREGKAEVEHESRGHATVYVDGSSRGTFSAPGSTSVTI